MAKYVKDGLIWKSCNVRVKDAGVWKTPISAHVKDGGIWKSYISAPTYSLTQTLTSLTEGDSVTYTLSTTNVADGTSFTWTASGSGISGSDFSGGSTTGTFSVSSGSGSFTITTLNSDGTDGNETLEMTITLTSTGVTVATGSSVTIVDYTPSEPCCPIGCDPTCSSLRERLGWCTGPRCT